MLLGRDKCFAGLSVECPGHCDLPGPIFSRSDDSTLLLFTLSNLIKWVWLSPGRDWPRQSHGLRLPAGAGEHIPSHSGAAPKLIRSGQQLSELAGHLHPSSCNNHNLLMKLVFTLTPAIQYKIFFPPGRRKQRDFVLFRDLSINNLTSHFPILIFGHINWDTDLALLSSLP